MKWIGETATLLQLLGATGFGALVGWFMYYVNRYRKGDVQLSDITTIIGIIGSAAITALFDAKSDMFGAYGIGLFVGFFSYLAMLVLLVNKSENFNSDWFLDGRRKAPAPPYSIPQDVRGTVAPAALAPLDGDVSSRTANVNVYVGQGASLGLTTVNNKAADIVAACEKEFETNSDYCNHFVIAVANRFGVSLSGFADGIVDSICGADWEKLADGPAAKAAADSGKLVIAGLKSGDHTPKRDSGHVAVVVAGPLADNHYPSAYWGSEAGSPGRNMTLNYSWRKGDRDKVIYRAKAI